MCLFKSKNLWNRVFPPSYKRAKKDMIVYKYLEKRPGYCVSPFRGSPYDLNKEKFSDLGKIESYANSYQVEEGLHSFTSLKWAEKSTLNWTGNTLFKAIIPKGSLYLKSNDGEIVSDRLIVTDEVIIISPLEIMPKFKG